MRIKEKVKKFYEEHDAAIEAAVVMVIPITIGAISYCLGVNVTKCDVANSIIVLHDGGFLKWWDPENDVEVGNLYDLGDTINRVTKG